MFRSGFSIKASRPVNDHRKTIRRTVTTALLLLAMGTFGYVLIEGWPVGRAFFFTIITLTTVGYGDYGLSATGELFTIVLILVGVGIFLNSLSRLAPILFNEKAAQERRMKNQISQLKNHFIICGLGRVGQACCRSLAMRDIPFVSIDHDEQVVADAIERGHLALRADATEDQVLELAGIDKARGLAAVTDSDTENIVITLGARQLNDDLQIISRAEQLGAIQKLKRAGVSRVISLVNAGGDRIANALLTPHLSNILDDRGEGVDRGYGIEFGEFTIESGSTLEGMSLRECCDDYQNVSFVALVHSDSGTVIRPGRDERFRAGDVLIAAGELKAIGQLRDQAQVLGMAA